jgi:hypothetical protein
MVDSSCDCDSDLIVGGTDLVLGGSDLIVGGTDVVLGRADLIVCGTDVILGGTNDNDFRPHTTASRNARSRIGCCRQHRVRGPFWSTIRVTVRQ